ncbi:hypothetical protein A2634_00200 [Candidatus Amesbacteria bacterium RIFCSPHIGHO2_01_FULL_48_32]|uniref:Uncharacterized protein n=1 Tax=Candidatus Amesbacteria bacterium RIFCSPLOWO2_01_FULL_48_25 TaxID=1797259 RepID=A0A1F4Z9Y8_9BACT|nr:MAG: hypothetical protein A2634_00200 [Candidatus Amesbacteria bacterium RIFCSPHIGHO2_01_FULL_48_32]OGD03229.1 MAG: hypothetical protein A2989_00150 [Candidatus Amesbacteria bacterium RIFCSPLOWO2_01_FULL_48_25]HJZ05172.1 tetratricopeptide repeat protein [Patescibacteria group bacterium]
MKKVPIVCLFLITGLITFFPVLGNDFLGDDFGQIVNNPYIRSMKNFPRFFGGSTFFVPGYPRLFGIYYKPVLITGYALIYAAFGLSPWAFHLVQVVLHATNAYLAYRILRHYFPDWALWLALIFLVHPINTEAVAYIANLQDILFVMFGLISVNLYLGREFIKPGRWVAIGLTLLLSLFSKETGLLFGLLAIAYSLIYARKQLSGHLITISGSLAGYAFFRFAVAGLGVNSGNFTPISNASLSERVFNIPNIVWYYAKTLVFPLKLGIYPLNLIEKPGLVGFVTLAIIIFLGVVGGYLAGKKFIHFVFFGIWFLMGLGAHLQIFPLDALAADRWFYFPLVGGLGILGGVINFKKSRVVVTGLIVILIGLSWRSFVRSGDFKNSLVLAQHDIRLNPNSPELESILGGEYLARGSYMQATEHLSRSLALFPNNGNVWYNLGVTYQKRKMFPEAIKAYEESIARGRYFQSFENLARLYLALQEYETAEKVASDGLKYYPANNGLLLVTAIAYYKTEDQAMAVSQAERLVRLNPSEYNRGVLDYISNRKPINISSP